MNQLNWIRKTKINIMMIPKTKHALIQFCRKVLQKSDDISYSDLEIVKNRVNHLLHVENLSPREIKQMYEIDYSDFGMFLKKCLGLTLKPVCPLLLN